MNESYKKYLNSKEWKEKRKERLRIDGYKCSCCGKTDNLNVHHISYDNIGHEEMSDLITLCKDCHSVMHKDKYKHAPGWVSSLANDSFDIIDLSAFCRFFEVSFGSKGKLFSYMLRNRDEENILFKTIQSLSEGSGVSVQTVRNAMKDLRENDIVRVMNGIVMFNPDYIKAKEDCGDGKLKETYESMRKYCKESEATEDADN